jgi:hypothetical protein
LAPLGLIFAFVAENEATRRGSGHEGEDLSGLAALLA